jgi:L,D-peptidoglycan transpeptidase YkuD (ErfK/YbiS/YcfS/YnhG family)
MHIKLINKKLYFNNYNIKCSIGKRGISKIKKEGDLRTPRVVYKFNEIFYRKDRVLKIKNKLKKTVITKNMKWCDDPRSTQYNKLLKVVTKYKTEKLYRRDNVYDILIVLNYNTKPVIKNLGSAIFLHIAKKNYTPTKGCIAVKKKDMYLILKFINKKTKIIIY